MGAGRSDRSVEFWVVRHGETEDNKTRTMSDSLSPSSVVTVSVAVYSLSFSSGYI